MGVSVRWHDAECGAHFVPPPPQPGGQETTGKLLAAQLRGPGGAALAWDPALPTQGPGTKHSVATAGWPGPRPMEETCGAWGAGLRAEEPVRAQGGGERRLPGRLWSFPRSSGRAGLFPRHAGRVPLQVSSREDTLLPPLSLQPQPPAVDELGEAEEEEEP